MIEIQVVHRLELVHRRYGTQSDDRVVHVDDTAAVSNAEVA